MLRIAIVLLLICSAINLKAVELPKNVYTIPHEKVMSSFPYITGDTVRESCAFIFDVYTTSLDASKVRCGDTIFVFIDYLEYFFKVYHPLIPEPYILVTHHFFDESDNDVPANFAKYLEDEKLIGWFTHNADRAHPKLHLLPIGIGNAFYDYGNKAAFDESINLYASKVEKKHLLYMNFNLAWPRPAERTSVYNFFRNKHFCTAVPLNRSLKDYLREVAESKFVLSPRGHGLDCFRTWETLLMRSYPVVTSSTLDPLFKNLPVVIIDAWSDVTEEFLKNKYEELSSKEFNWEKLYMPYWLEQIRQVKEDFLLKRAKNSKN